MIRVVRAGVVWLLLLAMMGLSSGCGSGNSPVSEADANDAKAKNTMGELAELIHLYKANKQKAPTQVSDLATYLEGFPLGYQNVKDGNIIVLWGPSFEESGSDKVFAYEKQTPESGGHVLMLDGATIKKMTADEFKAAAKAPGKAATAKP